MNIWFKWCFFRAILNILEEILLNVISLYTNSSFLPPAPQPCVNTSQVIRGREFMTNFIRQLIQGREFTTNCSFYFFFLSLFHLFNLDCSQSSSANLHYDTTCTICKVYVQREITLNSGKEISAPQIIQGREFTTREITSFIF